jgi:hypothetical protein
MKRIVNLLLAVLVIALESAATTQVKWLEEVHDFGAFDESEGVVTCQFKYVNTGDEPLVIVAARATCGCTTPQYSKEPLAPGDTASVTVSYNASGRPGRFSKKIYIDTNTEMVRSTLMIKGTVVGDEATVQTRFPADFGKLKLRTGSVAFGEVLKDHIKMVYLEGYNRSTDTIYPVITDLPRYIEVSSNPPAVAPGEQVQFNFYLRSDRCSGWGLITDSITIVPDTREPEKTYPYSAAMILVEDFSKLTPGQRAKAPHIAVDGPAIDFERLSRQSGSVTRTIKVYNTGKSVMDIHRVYTLDAGVDVKIDKTEIKSGKSATLTVTVNPQELPGDMLNAKVVVISNDPDKPTLSLRAVAELKD